MTNNKDMILNIIMKNQGKIVKELEEIARQHNKTYEEVATKYDQIRDKIKEERL